MSRSQFFQHGELPLVVLALLAREPRRGFDVMGELDRLFGPAYEASAGSVYPAMKALAEEGLVARIPGRAKFYAITDEGRRALEARGQMLAAIENRTAVRLNPADALDGVLERFAERFRALSGFVDPVIAEKVLDDAITQLHEITTKPSKGG